MKSRSIVLLELSDSRLNRHKVHLEIMLMATSGGEWSGFGPSSVDTITQQAHGAALTILDHNHRTDIIQQFTPSTALDT